MGVVLASPGAASYKPGGQGPIPSDALEGTPLGPGLPLSHDPEPHRVTWERCWHEDQGTANRELPVPRCALICVAVGTDREAGEGGQGQRPRL